MPVYLETACLLLGRMLMGLYFILPGVTKITDYAGTSAYMAEHNVPLISITLPLTIMIQLVGGVFVMIGFKGKYAAFLLAGLTLIINIYMHNFWVMEEGLARSHELQNFFKNMGIFAGLLIMTGLGSGTLSVDEKLKKY